MRWFRIAVIAATAVCSPDSFLFAQAKQARPPVSGGSPARKLAPAEQALLEAANRERQSHGLKPLKWSPALASVARVHAQKMAKQSTLSHELPGEPSLGMRVRMAGVPFRSVAENIAEGPSAAVIHDEWMNSPPHRANLLDPELELIGIAVVAAGGRLFAVQDFLQPGR